MFSPKLFFKDSYLNLNVFRRRWGQFFLIFVALETGLKIDFLFEVAWRILNSTAELSHTRGWWYFGLSADPRSLVARGTP